jgi:streptomycin 6-kinase
MAFSLPRNLSEDADAPGRTEWIATLPAPVNGLLARWSLRVGEPFQPGGRTAWVALARRNSFGEVVLKVARRHYEAFDEAKGLQEWDGKGGTPTRCRTV